MHQENPGKIGRSALLAYLPQGSPQILLDLGCGLRKREGHIGVDVTALAGVDIVADIGGDLPFEDGSIDGIYSSFAFEHVADITLLFKELYRICAPGARVEFRVPYYQSVTQFKDPTHKSVITPETLRYFSRDDWFGSDYGIRTNFKLLGVEYQYLPPFNRLFGRKLFLLRPVTMPLLRFARRHLWNVVHSITLHVEAVK